MFLLGVAALAIVIAILATATAYRQRRICRAAAASWSAERHALAQDLAGARRRTRAILNAGRGGAVVVNRDGTVACLSDTAAKLFGTTIERAVGHSALALTRDHDAVDALSHTLADRSERTVTTSSSAPGTPRSLRLTIVPIEETGEWSAVIFLEDVTELRRLETVRRDFVANVSHELRTPLSGMRAIVETLQDGALDEPEVATDFLERLAGEIGRLTQLVDELMDLGRIEARSGPFQFGEVDPAELVRTSVARLVHHAERAGVKLIVTADGDYPTILGDREWLGRAIFNLVHNAIKFTPVGGTVMVSLASEPDAIRMAVRDTGTGIEAADVPRVFERFYMVDAGRGGPGAGLGLAIVKHVAEGHGGSVHVESAVGRGSTFSLRLPRRRPPTST